MREDFEFWWDKEGQYSELCGKELCLIAWSNGEYKATYPAKTLTEEKCYEVVFDGENYTTKLVEPKLKTLTDAEIWACWEHSHGNTEYTKAKSFARAILRKAQEK